MDNPHCVSSTGSTNDDAYGLALNGAEHGFGIVASTQEGGKGRLGKMWHSPLGTGLYCSIVLRPALSFSEFPKLTLTAGLALCKTVENLLPELSFGLKWPNDLHCKGGKCGGILVEASSPTTNPKDSFVVVGLGLNVNTPLHAFPSELRPQVTSLLQLSGETFELMDIYTLFHSTLFHLLSVHESEGFDPIIKQWRMRDVLYGKEMQWVNSDKKIITATAMGPDDNGQLLARTRDGMVHSILSGDVRLAQQR
jgi:BirA family biotin operon repressor/biotin-[acetyl-CoA-carboxylase] ligase